MLGGSQRGAGGKGILISAAQKVDYIESELLDQWRTRASQIGRRSNYYFSRPITPLLTVLAQVASGICLPIASLLVSPSLRDPTSRPIVVRDIHAS